MTIFVTEDLESPSNKKLFEFIGVDYVATPRLPLGIVTNLVIGTVIAFIFAPVESLTARLTAGMIYGLLILVESHIHPLGHIITGKMAGAPPQAVMMTSSFYILQYDESVEHPSRVHVLRAIGGPLLNSIVALICFALYQSGLQSHYIVFFGIFNLVVAILAMMPIPTVDGHVILRELLDWKPA